MRLSFCALTLGSALIALAGPASAQSRVDDDRFARAQERFDREYQLYREEADRYRSVRDRDVRYAPAYDERYENGYDPSRDYRAGNYQERTLRNEDRVYAGTDGRYYCKRSDGTTGLIIGGASGGILGNVIDGGRSRTVGTLLGAAAGALAGRAIDQNQNQIRCR